METWGRVLPAKRTVFAEVMGVKKHGFYVALA